MLKRKGNNKRGLGSLLTMGIITTPNVKRLVWFYTVTSCQPWLQNVSKEAYTITQ